MKKIISLIAALVFASQPALAQTSYPTTSSGTHSGVVVPLQCDVNKKNCQPVTAANPIHVSGTVTVSGSGGLTDTQLRATPVPVSGTISSTSTGNVAHGTADSGNPVKIGGKYYLTVPTLTDGWRGDLRLDSRGALVTTIGSGSGSYATVGVATNGNTSTNSALFVASHNLVHNGTAWSFDTIPASTSRLLSAGASTNSTLVKNGAGQLFRISGYNAKAGAVYLKIYNKATAPTCGTDTPVQTYYLAQSANFNIDFSRPYYFATGIGYCLTGAEADADTTALTAADILAMNVIYQ